MISLCDKWEFSEEWSEAFCRGEEIFPFVRLPHEVRPLPLHYATPEKDYEGVFGYRRRVVLPAPARGRRVFLQFDGAAHQATVYWNGQELASHRCGYTGFRVEVPSALCRYEEENLLAVRLTSREDKAIPPFGHLIDYLTCGGLYREVWLDIRETSYIKDVVLNASAQKQLSVQAVMDGSAEIARIEVLDGDRCMAFADAKAFTEGKAELAIPAAGLWSPEHPQLYTCRIVLTSGDEQSVLFGFRTAEFREDGFFLNGEKLFLRGLNRHQSYPWLGYAAPESLQREDARILKEELGCNAVRTSHYPQSQHFLKACDELGLLVFTELPGWQHIGDESWKQQALTNLEEMVLQNRNHPSIILWGVRINESRDDNDFYRRTNELCHRLDPSRPTSGVRYLEKSRLLEDVYAFNDFSHNGKTPGVRPKSAVMNGSAPLLISEHNGHMYPTKSFDSWARRQEQALRHGRVLAAAMADGQHAGCFGWCMFDYQTHADFGSGDRVCYHGVMDAFRNPKLAAAMYASQQDKTPVLVPGSLLDIGDYPGGDIGEVYLFTNADEVDVYKNDVFVTTLREKTLPALPHGPMLFDDRIGQLLETQEGFTGTKARLLHRCLLTAAKQKGRLSFADRLQRAWCVRHYHILPEEETALNEKYVGNWGGEAIRWRFDAKKGNKVVKTVTCSPGSRLHLEAKASSLTLKEGATYDMAAVRIRVADENGHTAVYAQLPLQLSLEGPAELIGPAIITAEGGMSGTYVRSTGISGTAVLHIYCPQTEAVEVKFQITAP